MKTNYNQMNLAPIPFNKYIWSCFLEFLDEYNEKMENEGKQLKEGTEFNWNDTKNRNPIVPQKLWEDILLRHLHHLNYN